MPDNSEIDDPAGWEDITREDLFYAFRKAKTDCFYEHTVLAADRFTAYEAELFSNLNRLCDRIKAGDVDALFAENLGEVAVVAKKLNKTPNRNNRKGLHDFFSDPTKFFERLTRDTTLHPEFRLVGDFPVEMHVLSALWINLVGHRFDARLGPHVYGSRLRRYRMVDNQDTRVAGRYHREALGIFEPYFTPYKTWRNRGLGTMRAELKAGRAIIAISLDLSNYYHRIDPNFIAAPHFQAALGVNLSPWATSFTRTFADSMSNWANRTTELLKTYGCELRDDVPGGLPIGLAAARLAANVLLHQLDQAFMAGLAPIYYGRYVDDMFLVLQDSWSFGSAQDLFHWIQARVPLLQSTKREEMEIRFEPEYSAHSKITLQKSKQRVFFLSGSVGLDLLSNIESEINEVSSERRLMPDPEALEHMAAAKVLTAAESASDPADAMRKADGLSVRRLGWSILLHAVETLARDLVPADWQDERKRFYEFARAHILRADRLLDHVDYLPRLLSLAVALEDWSEAANLLEAFDAATQALKEASLSRKGTRHSDYTFTLNGHHATSDATAVWLSFELHFRAIAGDAIIRSIRWRAGSTVRLGETAGKVCARVGLDFDAETLNRRALELRESDWAKMPYREHLRRHAQHPRFRVPDEAKLAELYRESVAVREFLADSEERDENGGSACRRSAKARKTRLTEESLLPYILPTRPYTAQEIALFVPSCAHGEYSGDRSLWARFVRGLRGSWVRATSNGIPEVPPPLDSDLVGTTPVVWPVGIGTSHAQSVTLGITSLLTEYVSWSKSAANKPDYSPSRYRRIAGLVKQAVRGQPRPTHLFLPELSIPERWLGTISRLLSDSNISLVAGLEYSHSGTRIHSDVALILSDNSLGYPSWVEIRQRKAQPAPDEEETLLHKFGKFWAPDGPVKPVYNHKGFHFGVLVCSELQNIEYRRRFQGNVDCLAVLAWNQDLETFSALVESAALDVHSYIALVNNRKFGDSRVRLPAKEAYRRDTCRIRGGENDYLVMIHLDLESLRAFQSRVKRWTQPGDGFKPVPEGFKMFETRKTIPR